MVRSHGIKHNTLATIRQAGLLIRVNSRLAAPQSSLVVARKFTSSSGRYPASIIY